MYPLRAKIPLVCMSDQEFEKYKKLIYDNFGIYLKKSKKDMIRIRLTRLMKEANVSSCDEYYSLLTESGHKGHWSKFADEITIHTTDFFREKGHFEFLEDRIDFITQRNPRIWRNKEIRIWSAGCSTGEEPYTLAMVLKEILPPEIEIKILATDVSSKSILQAQRGNYSSGNIERGVGKGYKGKYFERIGEGHLRVTDEIRKLVTFRTFNLMRPFPFNNTFDAVFCRNVMIYFDYAVQDELVRKYYNVVEPGGLLFVGHSESLTGKQNGFKYIQPTIYMKPTH